MLNDPLFLVVAGACLLVVVILIFGIANFGKGTMEAAKRSNQMMRWRIYAQAAAVALIILFVFVRRMGGQ